MASVYTSSTGNAANFNTTDLDNVRRIFNFGDRVAELAPNQSPFFVYLSKVAKKATNDPVFKFSHIELPLFHISHIFSHFSL